MVPAFELAKTRTAQASSVMREPLQRMEGQPLHAVHERIEEDSTIEYFFLGSEHVLIIAANENDDSIETRLTSVDKLPPTLRDVSAIDPWNSLIGKDFGWCSLTINQQGYCDGILMSFDGICPQVFLTVIASSFKLGRITM